MVSKFAILGPLELGVSQLLWSACVGFRCSGLACGCFVGFRAWGGSGLPAARAVYGLGFRGLL